MIFGFFDFNSCTVLVVVLTLSSAENIYIEPEVMRHYGREDLGVAIPDGDGYIGTLNVYHELHCIVRNPSPPMRCPLV